MALASSSSSSSSSSSKPDVFLSFRGEDTRGKFTSHLHAKLIQKNIATFIDFELLKGGGIEELIEAIQRSRISVIILSENYASSSWCLDELVYILKCKKERGQIVVPVFYDVDPSDVRRQGKSYAAAFARYEKEKAGKVDEWRGALVEVANLSGWHLRSFKGTEAEFAEAIAKDILGKLNQVGIDKKIDELEKLLRIDDSASVRFIVISGMGGLGKTTLAHRIFQQFFSEFQGCCFLANVREESAKLNGLERLKERLFSKLLEERDLDTITDFHKEILRHKKVLIVLDDVDDKEQLNVLAADRDWFGPGSRIIVTTRDAQVLRQIADEIYELERLTFDNALELFTLNAFKRNYTPTADDAILSKEVVNYADGNPLALKVLGSFLRARRKVDWENELTKLKDVSSRSIHNILRIIFDSLDVAEREIFLDVVCFLRTEWMSSYCRKFVERRLGAHHSYVHIVIDNLIDKSLITVKDNNILAIHDLLMQMGEEIERQSIKEPGKRRRLWSDEDVHHVLKNNKGSPTIEGISCGINIKGLSPNVFKEMNRLWLLDLSRSHLEFSQGVHHLPDSLKCLIWNFWSCKSLPSNFLPHNLVELTMPYSNLQQLWSGVQELGTLKYVDLSFSESLTEISALSQAPNLVSVNLSGCGSLRKVPSLRFQTPDNLSLDQSHHKCNHDECQTIGHLKLDYCINLRDVENVSGNLKELHLSFTSVAELPSSIWSFDNLVYLNLSECESLKRLPNDIRKLKSLKRLDISRCSSLDKLPNEIGSLSLIEKLSLDGSNIEKIPVSIKNLSKLIELSICNCKRLQSLPELPLSLELLDASGCISLQTISNLRNVVTQGLSGNHVLTYGKFFYADCLKLDQNTRNSIVSEFQLRTLDTSIKSALIDGVLKVCNLFPQLKLARLLSILQKSDHPGVAISCPGNTIPLGFTHQSESSSIKVELSPDWKHKFFGFALCAVVAGDISHFNLSCEATFKTKSAKSFVVHWDFNNVDTNYIRFKTRNLFMWYNHENYDEYLDVVEVLFSFKTKFSREDKVRACGICLLDRQAAEKPMSQMSLENQILVAKKTNWLSQIGRFGGVQTACFLAMVLCYFIYPGTNAERERRRKIVSTQDCITDVGCGEKGLDNKRNSSTP